MVESLARCRVMGSLALVLVIARSCAVRFLCISYSVPVLIQLLASIALFLYRVVISPVIKMHPIRKSSEGPEVVPSQTESFLAERQSNVDKSRIRKGTQYETPVADVQSPGLDPRSAASPTPGYGGGYETPDSVSSPRGTERKYQTPGSLYDLSACDVQAASGIPRRDRKGCGLVTTIILLIVAFIIGGGVGGGVGGAIAVKSKHSG